MSQNVPKREKTHKNVQKRMKTHKNVRKPQKTLNRLSTFFDVFSRFRTLCKKVGAQKVGPAYERSKTHQKTHKNVRKRRKNGQKR